MNKATFLEGILLRQLIRLVRKYGIIGVLQALIQIAKTDTDKPKRTKTLVADLERALTNYKEG
jgi:hypothetical protein